MNNAERDALFAELEKRVAKVEDSWGNWLKNKSNKFALFSAIMAALTIVGAIISHFVEDRKSDVAWEVRKQLDPLGNKLETLSTQLASLNTEVGNLKDNVNLLLSKALAVSSALPQKQFDQNLPVVNTQISVARQLQADIDPAVRKDLRKKLLDSSLAESESLWSAKANFISYESAVATARRVLDASVRLPECFSGEGRVIGMDYDARFGCTFVLENVNLINATLRNAIIIYRGGKTKLDNVKFDHCYFVFRIQSVPAPGGQKFINQLLASDQLKSVTAG